MMNEQQRTVAHSVTEVMSEQLDRLVAFHQGNILPDSTEEDIEMRERQIMKLQHEFSVVRSMLRELPVNGN